MQFQHSQPCSQGSPIYMRPTAAWYQQKEPTTICTADGCVSRQKYTVGDRHYCCSFTTSGKFCKNSVRRTNITNHEECSARILCNLGISVQSSLLLITLLYFHRMVRHYLKIERVFWVFGFFFFFALGAHTMSLNLGSPQRRERLPNISNNYAWVFICF